MSDIQNELAEELRNTYWGAEGDEWAALADFVIAYAEKKVLKRTEELSAVMALFLTYVEPSKVPELRAELSLALSRKGEAADE